MSVSINEVKELIEQGFSNAVAEIGEENHRVTGSIIWPDFRGKSAEDRNKLVTERVRNKLGHRGTNIGLLLPLASLDEFRGKV